MKRRFSVPLTVALVVCAWFHATYAQDRVGSRRLIDEGKMLAGFNITVERTHDGLALTCAEGCAWKTLEIPASGRPTPINAFGMARDKTSNPERRGNFLLRIGTTEDGIALSCDRGCAWRKLTFALTGKPARFNEYGKVGANKPW